MDCELLVAFMSSITYLEAFLYDTLYSSRFMLYNIGCLNVPNLQDGTQP